MAKDKNTEDVAAAAAKASEGLPPEVKAIVDGLFAIGARVDALGELVGSLNDRIGEMEAKAAKAAKAPKVGPMFGGAPRQRVDVGARPGRR